MATTDEERPPAGEDREPALATASPEEQERIAAVKRARERAEARERGGIPTRGPYTGSAPADVAARAFAALAEGVRDYAVFLMDPDGVITFWGEGARLIKWWSKDEAEGAHLRLLYPPGGAEDGTAEAHLVDAVKRGEYAGEGHRVRSDGSTFWAGVVLTALYDESGEKLLGFAKVTRDLTARRAADALLQQTALAADRAREEAEAANVAKSAFLASMSHEIRTPINAVIGYLQLLEIGVDGPLNERQRRHIGRADASARHLDGIVTEVLDFARIEGHHEKVGRKSFVLGDVVESAVSIVTPRASQADLELVDATAGYAAGLSVWGDEMRVRQILVNLLTNAIKFTGTGVDESGRPVRGRVTVSAGTALRAASDSGLTGEGPWVFIRVEDTGEGIPRDRLESIFDPFVQADMSLTRRHGGTGLGLSISRHLARLMGGEITVRSEVGLGSTFFVWLPAAPVQSLATGGVQGHGPGSTDAPADPVAYSMGGTGGPLRAAASAVLGELERILHAYVARLRNDPATPSARRASDAELEDHLATFLSDLAGVLQGLDGESGDRLVGEAAEAINDSTAIQRVVCNRHGAQRARLGWTEEEMRREFTILREELGAAMRRRSREMAQAPDETARQHILERAFEVVGQFMQRSEQLSLEAFRRGPGTRAAS